MNSLSYAETTFIKDGIASDFRGDGRGRFDYRTFQVDLGTISQASGSARVQLDTTDVLIGIKAEIGNVDPETPLVGKVVCNVECCPSASQAFEGRGAQELNNELTETIQRILCQDAALNMEKLCILPGRLCWTLFIDALVLDNGGNLLDCIMLGIRAALSDTKIPQINIVMTEGAPDIELCQDQYTFVDISNVPVTVTLNQIGQRFVIDASLAEDLCVDSKVVVAVNKAGNILNVKKFNSGTLPPSILLEMISAAKTAASGLLSKLDLLFEQSSGKATNKGLFA